MAFKVAFAFVASILLAQTAQCCPCGVSSYNSGLSYGFGYGNAANAGVLNGLNAVSLGYNGYDALELISGSPITPNGISVLAENLELAGPVAVSGSMPFAGAVGICGTVPTCGSAGVSYSTAPGAGLTSSGCGAGLAGTGYAGAALASNAYAFGNNGYGLGNNLYGARSSCGC